MINAGNGSKTEYNQGSSKNNFQQQVISQVFLSQVIVSPLMSIGFDQVISGVDMCLSEWALLCHSDLHFNTISATSISNDKNWFFLKQVQFINNDTLTTGSLKLLQLLI